MTYRRAERLGKHHPLDEFGCGEPALDEWLKRHARGAQASDSARVYVATLDDGETVVGYCTLATARVGAVPAILLARLAVDVDHQRAGLGRSLLQDALLRCVEAAGAIGARVLLVHAKHEAAKTWYMQFGFEESPTDALHLLMLMKDVRAFLRQRGVT